MLNKYINYINHPEDIRRMAASSPDDIKIGRVLEEQEEREMQQEIQNSARDDLGARSDTRTMALLIVTIIGIFALLLGGFTLYNHYSPSAAVVNVDSLHAQNLEGELDEEEGYVYNGYSFVKADGLWWTEMNKFGTLLKIPLHFGPKELGNIPVNGELDPAFNSPDEIYIAIDPKVQNKYYSLAVSELSFNIVKGLDRTPVGSCTEENWACDNRTIVSCENAAGRAVIELALEGSPGITIEGTCIILSGANDYDIVKSVDRLLYKWYGVMG